eukprot:3381894-Pyramimonas_sp.AAC.1
MVSCPVLPPGAPCGHRPDIDTGIHACGGQVQQKERWASRVHVVCGLGRAQEGVERAQHHCCARA